jgi:hypothetical protein
MNPSRPGVDTNPDADEPKDDVEETPAAAEPASVPNTLGPKVHKTRNGFIREDN